MIREDISSKLIHLTRNKVGDSGNSWEEAIKIFESIVNQKKIIGGTGFIKGSHKCVCFTEAPISKLAYILAKSSVDSFKYAPYGIMIDKKTLFEKGGRPVIYGSEEEYDKLPEAFKYRHVRFRLADDYTIDHTWNREWRIKTEALLIQPEDVTLVVPNRKAKNDFEIKFSEKWHYIVLSDLGVLIE